MGSKHAMKKIMVIGPMSSGHIQRWIIPLINKYNFEIVTLHNSIDVPEGVNVRSLIKFFNNRLDFFVNIPYLLYLFCKIRPDLVHVHFLSSYGIMASFLPRNVKKILSIWGTDLNGKPTQNKVMRFLASRALLKYDIINVPANHMKDKLNRIFDYKIEENIVVFQYGVELSKLPQRASIVDNPIIKIASVRNWDELYHISDLISAFSKVENENLRLFVYGKGSKQAESTVQALINSFNDPRITIMGFVKRNKMLEQLATMDIVVSIPDKDGAPLSLMEAMYIGLYPLVSTIDANIEWLDNSTATFIDSYCQDTIVDAILLSSHKVRMLEENTYIIKNRASIIRNGDYEKNIRKMDDIYIKLLN